VIRRKVAVAIQISALLLSGCLGFAVAAAAAGAGQAIGQAFTDGLSRVS
jgi:hypothetical protein